MRTYCFERHSPGVACGNCQQLLPMTVDVKPILDWLEDRRSKCEMNVERVELLRLDGWAYDPGVGSLYRQGGQFFTVAGMRITGAVDREVTEWSQPMICQRSMGILGLLVQKNISGDDMYLLQAKAEPGNVGKLLLSPTLQSTQSNLVRAHGGHKSPFAQFFEDPHPGSVEFDVDQTEDGGRFYLKTNRNMIVRLPDAAATDLPLKIPDHFMWLSLPTIKALLRYSCVINHAVRSIIAAIG